MAARSIWSGSISFGLVNIPVKLFTAVKDSTVHFHLLHEKDMSRLQRKLVCAAEGKEVSNDEIVRGYEIAPDQYVVIEDKELENLAPKASRTIEIRDFVDLADIDPLYYDRPYYVAPGERAAKPYRLLVEAMERSKKVGIATFVMRSKEYLAALRPLKGAICLVTMRFGEEVVPVEKIEGDVAGAEHAKVDDRELKMAAQLIDSLTTAFDPAKYHDEYKERVMQLVESKAAGEKVVTQPPVEEHRGKVINLMAALEASLAEAKAKSKPAKAHAGANGHAAAHHQPRRRKSA